MGVESIIERMGTEGLAAEQRTAFQQIRNFYRARLERQGAAEGKNSRQIRTDLAEPTDPSDAGRAAIGCLRQLEREQT